MQGCGGVGHAGVWWGGSCSSGGGVGHVEVGWGCVMQGWGVSCRGGGGGSCRGGWVGYSCRGIYIQLFMSDSNSKNNNS